MTAVLSTPLLARAPCTAAEPLRVGVLVSGSGSNLQALLDAASAPGSVFRVVVVVSNVDGVRAVDRARAAGVPVVVEPHRGLDRAAHESRVHDHLQAANVELVVLAGYMRVLTSTLLQHWPQRVVNVHPALLPSFPGLHGAKQALDHGCRIAGCTVHLVDDGVDTGPILAQAAVPVLDHDDEAALQSRIQAQEHRLLPAVVRAFARGLVVVADGRVRALGLHNVA
jgi:phosphoribosylglycinamide formyltransferase-1